MADDCFLIDRCQNSVVERRGFEVYAYFLAKEGRCQDCGTLNHGHWEKPKERKQMFYLLR
ncbi:MAG: hypothetical protein ACW98K_09530 [Candidatus Kariarchaeaceae archaeon]